jgi:sulfite oxidase
VLAAAGVRAEARHVAFTGLDEIVKGDVRFGYGASIPLEKARAAEVLLAYEMNGAPLAPDHGAPLRVVVPGHIGARRVKWLSTITAQAEPSDNDYQAHTYRLFPPDVRAETADWSRAPALGDAPLTSAICSVQRTRAPDGAEQMVARGYAYTGGGRGIARVEVALDGREPWMLATLALPLSPWAWRLWEARLPLRAAGPDAHELVCRAWDDAGNGQPESLASVWNFRATPTPPGTASH